jgi:hypothetical protein
MMLLLGSGSGFAEGLIAFLAATASSQTVILRSSAHAKMTGP